MSSVQKLKNFIRSIGRLSLRAERFLEQRKKEALVNSIQTGRTEFGINPHIVISLTSYPARFGTVCKTLKSILNQSMKPDRIIVWLDAPPEMVTAEMRSLEKYGIEYRCSMENLKPHKKYFFAMQEFPQSLVVTVDDDLVYPKDLVRSLFMGWKNHPDCVCARRVHKMTFNSDGKLKAYNDWMFECRQQTVPSHLLVATSGAGVLYPPGCLDKRAFDAESIKRNCLDADDIWLKAMELLNGTKVFWVKNTMVHPPVVDGSQQTALCHTNVMKNRNDVYIANMERLFGEEIRSVLADSAAIQRK